MKYKIELHVHSADVSNCAKVSAEEIVENYVKAGYSTLVLANHMSRFTYKNKRVDYSYMTWDEKVDFFLAGYEKLKAAAEGKLHVLLAMELRFNSDSNDYLVYGITEEFLRQNPTMMDEKLENFIEIAHNAGCLFYQAHPFRNGMKIVKPHLLDGIEVYNGHVGHDSRNEVAYHWAEKYNLRKISGSDYHESIHPIDAGILTDTPITSNEELLNVLKSENYELIRTGDAPY